VTEWPATLDRLLARAAEVWPGQVALVTEAGKVTTYTELASLAASMARGIRRRVPAGSNVGILARNSPESVAAYFAVHAAGCVVVWLNHSQDPSALAPVAADAELELLVSERAFAGRAARILPGRHTTLTDIVEPGESGDLMVSGRNAVELASIVYTSGSTDRPLGVMLSHRNLLSNTASIAEYLQLGPSDTAFCVLPFYYIYGLSVLLTHVAVGATVVIENGFLYPQTAVDAMEASAATGFAGVSTHYAVLLAQTNFASRELPYLRYLTHAGDKMPPTMAERLGKLFPRKRLFLMYGQTEAAPRLAYLDPGKVLQKPGSTGSAVPGVSLRVVDEEGREVGSGVEGEIEASGLNIMMGYWKRPEETAIALRDGWLRTGDLGYRDADGDLYIVGRRKAFLKVGGHRVSPHEIESVTDGFRGVGRSVAVGVPDPVLGQHIRVFLTESSPGAIDLGELAAHYRKRLPSYKVPSEAVVLPVLPLNEQGKIDRRRLESIEPQEVIVLASRVKGATSS
jgi:acyl-CoA synthetase (AMP-forming)/AMP-acid ligase II